MQARLPMTNLFWFRKDLRLEDNPGLVAMADANSLLCVYFWPRDIPWCNTRGLGDQRKRFLLESLRALHDQLRSRGQSLMVFDETPEMRLPQLIRKHRVARIGTDTAPGVYEAQEVARVSRITGLRVEQHRGNSLFGKHFPDLAQASADLQFTPFRHKVENMSVDAPLQEPELPPPPAGLQHTPIPDSNALPHPAFLVRGGSEAGKRRLQTWMFRERAVSTYRDTRNSLEGQFFASNLSPWLATGCLSVREIAEALQNYEQRYGRNESTVHYFSELLWREYFHCRALTDRVRLFRPGGLRGSCTLRCFEPRSYARWCAGNTDYPLVNALMHQLVATGFMSNRGRQIVASCLVNELKLDWRYGAAFFEKHLIDYEVGSNYGNWQYIAGVGTDPRGGRHFNLQKQTAQYDPQGTFITRWDGSRAPQPEFVTDAADWPITPGDSTVDE